MLDGARARRYRVADALDTMGVRRDGPPRLRRLSDRHRQFVWPELHCARRLTGR
jgi:hypothetical protein